MRKTLPWPALFLAPGICLLNSCASYNLGTSPRAERHVFLYVQTLPGIEFGDPSLPKSKYGYAVGADGALTPLAGSPHPGSLWGVMSGRYFFAGEPHSARLDTYLIGTDGSFTKIHSVLDKATAQCTDQCSIGPNATDRTGSSLYVGMYSYNSADGAVTPETYRINKDTGELTYVSPGGTDWTFFKGGCELNSFSGDDRYAYGPCTTYEPSWLEVAARKPDGSLSTPWQLHVIGPTAPPGVHYSPLGAWSDAENHLAMLLYSWDAATMNPLYNAPTLLASYTINPDGSLTTTNTTTDMPALSKIAAFGGVSPSGKLFAVGESDGIQLFNLNGAAPATSDGGLIPTDTPVSMMWDDEDHLYVLSLRQKLYVFTATGTGMVQAPGSPHSIPNAAFLSIASF